MLQEEEEESSRIHKETFMHCHVKFLLSTKIIGVLRRESG